MAYRKVFQEASKDQETDLQSGIVGGASAPSAPGQGAGGSAWTNLQTYIDANKGQGAGVANAITQKTQENIDTIGKDTQAWEMDAKKRVDEKTRKDDFSSQIKDDPTKVDQGAFSAWKSLGNYWGENQADKDSGYADVSGKTQKAKQDLAGANDYYGQQVLAKKAFGQDEQGNNRNYSDGMGYLDTFVARAEDTGKQAFQDFKDKNANFGQGIQNSAANVNSYIGNAQKSGQFAYDQVMSAITGERAEREGAVDQRYKTARDQGVAAARAEADQIKKNLMGGYNPEFSSGVDQYSYIKENDAFDGSDVLEQADLDALNALSGLDNQSSKYNAIGTDKAASFDWETYQKAVSDEFSDWSKNRPKTGSQTGTFNPFGDVPVTKAPLPTPGTLNLPLPVDVPGYVNDGTDTSPMTNGPAPTTKPGTLNLPLPIEVPRAAPAPAPKSSGGDRQAEAKKKKLMYDRKNDYR